MPVAAWLLFSHDAPSFAALCSCACVVRFTKASTCASSYTISPRSGGEKLKKAKATVTKLQKDISDGEADAAKKAVLVRWLRMLWRQYVMELNSGFSGTVTAIEIAVLIMC